MPTYSQVSQLRGQGKSFREIGASFTPAITRQRAHAIFTGYARAYQRGEEWKMYKRHSVHEKGRKVCFYCS